MHAVSNVGRRERSEATPGSVGPSVPLRCVGIRASGIDHQSARRHSCPLLHEPKLMSHPSGGSSSGSSGNSGSGNGKGKSRRPKNSSRSAGGDRARGSSDRPLPRQQQQQQQSVEQAAPERVTSIHELSAQPPKRQGTFRWLSGSKGSRSSRSSLDEHSSSQSPLDGVVYMDRLELTRLDAEWVPDSYSKHCEKCYAKFTAISRRRHHCRRCGCLVCHSCSSNTVRPFTGGGPFSKKKERLRVCDDCFSELGGRKPPSKRSRTWGGSGEHDLLDL